MSTALTIRGLRRSFGRVVALDGIDLDVGVQEVMALVGPSGCGKSTLLRLVAGLLAPHAGTIDVGNRRLTGAGMFVPPERRGIGIVFQEHLLFPHLTVEANIAFGLDQLPRRERRSRVEDSLRLVDLTGYGDRYPHELSGGERQRIALARALAPGPSLVLLDEPFAALDPNLRNQVRAETVDILRRANATAVLVTHDQREALGVCDRLVVMRDGRVEQEGAPATLFHAPANRFVGAFLGEADFLPARTAASGDLVTELGPCPGRAGFGTRDVEGDVEVMVRPHEVEIVGSADGTARVVRNEFQGAFVLYTVELPSGQHVRSLQPHTSSLAVGDTVDVRFDPGHVPALLPGASGTGDAVTSDPTLL
jgi:iron(III) transport system ATP-binding protein